MTDLRKLQISELEVLRATVRICEGHGLKYYMLGGTLLGAVRHKGFIPWDDDIDIGLPRPDYERFLKIAPSYLRDGLLLQTYRQTAGYFHYPAKVVDETVTVVTTVTGSEQTIPAWIDVFPLDGMPDSYLANRLHQFRLLLARALFKLACFEEVVSINAVSRPLTERILIWLGRHFKIGRSMNPIKRMDKIDRMLKKYPPAVSKYYINFMGAYKTREMFPQALYGPGRLYQFEDMNLVGPLDSDTILTQMYGDYMKFPPEEERNKHFTRVKTIDGNEMEVN